MLKPILNSGQAGTSSQSDAQDALQRIAGQLRGAGASAQHVPGYGTFTESTIDGLSIALCLLEGEIAGKTLLTLRGSGPAQVQQTVRPASGTFDFIENLGPGERYAGLVLDADGKPLHHLILLPGDAEDVTWAQAKEFAAQAGGELPTRAEQAILFGNAKGEFKPTWYWSSEQHAADDVYAWIQYFLNGTQVNGSKSAGLRARAVRRLPI